MTVCKRLQPGWLKYSSPAALTLGAAALIPSPETNAQQVVADGVQVTATGTINTGTITAAPGYGLSALNGGSILTNSPITVITGGQDAFGAAARSAGSVSLFDASTISTSGAGAVGVSAAGVGSKVTATAVTVQTTGEPSNSGVNPAHGVYAIEGGQITLTGGSVSTRGMDAIGLYSTTSASGTLSLLTATDTLVRTFSDRADGAVVNNGQMLLNNVTIETTGPLGIAVRADGAGTITMSGGSVTTSGAGGTGVLAVTDSRIFLTNVAISVEGDDARGVGAQAGARVSVTGGTIMTTGARGYGISSATASGNTNARAFVDVAGTTITTAGADAHGVRILGAADVALSDSTLTTNGVGASALYSAPSGPGDSTVTITGSTLASAQDFGVRTDRTTFGVSLTGSTLSGAAGLLTTGTGAVLNLTADSSTLTGGALTDAAGVSNLRLQNGTLWTLTGTASSLTSLELDNASVRFGNDSSLSASNGISLLAGGGTFDTNGFIGTASTPITGSGSLKKTGAGTLVLTAAANYTGGTTIESGTLAAGAANIFSPSSGHIVQADGTLDLRGFDQTVASLNNGGIVRLGGLPGTTLSVSGAYVSQGGFLALNTILDGDASATDRLVAGRVELGSDATGVIVNKVSGAGALTTGNGIKLVHVNDATASAAGAFELAGRVTAGAYEYTLYQGGINGATGDGNWYLRSTLDCSLAANASACDEQPPEIPGEPPVTPPVTPPEGPKIPNYRAETSLYTALPSMTLLYGRNLMDSRVERIGDESTGRTASGSQGWGRIIGLRGSRDGSSSGIYTGGPAYDYDIFALQTGVDLYRADRPDGSGDRAGLYGAVGQISADVTHFTGRGAGKNKIDAYSLGAYWTRLGASGWYLDGVGQLTWNDAKSTPNGVSGLDTNGLGFAASIEGGQRLQFDGGFSVEPQAQLVYQTAHLSDTSDAGASVRFSDIDSLAARVGVRFSKAWPLDGQAGAPRQIKAWLRPSVWHEFLGEPKTEFSSTTGSIPFKDKLDGSWAEIAAGLDADISKNTSVYGNLGYQVGFDGKSDAYTAKVGLRINW